MNKEMKEIYIFIDTMIYLHYRPIEEINLPEMLDAEKVIIVIPRITIREIDKEKNTHKQSRIRERAKKVLDKIEKWLQNEEPIRPGVSIIYYESIPHIPFEEYGLNPNWNDDFLLATMLQYKHKNPTAQLYLLSQDSGPRLTAQHLGIPALELPHEFMLPGIVDPVELENIELKRMISKLQSSRPQLVVCFAGSEPPESYVKFQLKKPLEPVEKEIENKLNEIREIFPKRYPSSTNQMDATTTMEVAVISLQSLLPTPPEEYDRYNKEIDEYISSYEQYMRETWKVKELARRTIQFQIEIRNIGTAPR